MSSSQMIGYQPNNTIIHRLNGSTKLFAFLLLTFSSMASYDTRFLLGVGVGSVLIFMVARINYHAISFVLKFIVLFASLNLLTVYLFSPEYGVELYGTRTLIFEGIGRYTLTKEQLFYEGNLALKYVCMMPPALIFLMTTDPSEFAASLNKIGVSYHISYAVSLALRYIPDVQQEFVIISQAQQARGCELSKKAGVTTRVKGLLQIVTPLIFSSLEKITTISNAMELRRFGKEKKRTWYREKKFALADYVTVVIVLLIVGLSFYLVFVNQGRFYNPFV